MDYRGIFLYENSSVFCAEEFIFMVNFDEIEFLESEIVDDDPTAPVGTLVHITEDGKVEEVEQKQDVKAVESDAQNETRADEANEIVEVENSDNEQNEITQTITTDVQDEPQIEETVQSEEEAKTSQPEVVEQAEEVEEATDAQTEEAAQVADESAQTVESESEVAEETAIESTEETAVEATEDVQEVAPQDEIVEEPQNESSQEPAPVEENVTENAVVEEESAQEVQSVETAQDEQPEEQKPVQKAKKPRKPAQKKEAAPVVVNDEEHKTSLNLKNGKSVNDELFGTSFEIEQPAKAKIVSTKKKQEKAEDLWAVATVAKPKKETAPVNEEAQEEVKPVKKTTKKATTKTAESAPKAQKAVESAPKAESEDVKPAPKKTASKKSTKVENTNTSTEEKKVAKTTKDVASEEKPVKASKTAKEAPVKEAPVKEETAHKVETKTAKDDETVIVEGEGKTHGKYVIKKTDKGNFVFKLYSSNYRVVAIGAQAYTTLGAAKIGIQSIINNAEKAPVENQTLKNYEVEKFPKWEIYQDKKGEYRLRLFATNGNLIATTNDGYADITGAKNGIAAVARASKGCAIVRNDNLW